MRKCSLVIVAALFCYAADGLEVIKVKENRALIRLDGSTVSVDEQLDVIDASGKKTGVIRVTSFNATKALTKIENGLVNVGMRVTKRTGATDYSYDFRVNPLIVLGAVNANFDFKITENLTAGLQGAYLHAKLNPTGIFNSDFDVTAYGIGARANWFFNGAFKDGYYLGPSLEYLNVSIKTTDAFGAATGTAAGLMASCLIGYGWFWDSFNVMLGGGYASALGTSSITIKDPIGNQETISANLSGLTYELSLGWAF